jgi:hypothetical protein
MAVQTAADCNSRSLPPQEYSITMNIEEPDVPSDEEAQDSTLHPVFAITTPHSSRRRSRSLILFEKVLPHSSAPLDMDGYESEPSDLSSGSLSDQDDFTRQQHAIRLMAHRRVRETESEISLCPSSQQQPPQYQTTTCSCHKRWPFRLFLLACAYIAWTTDSYTRDNDAFLVKKRAIPKASAAAFSSQHGREVTMRPMEEQSPLLRGLHTYSIPTAQKRRPQVAHALASKQKPLVLGEARPMERFVLDEDAIPESVTATTVTTTKRPYCWMGYMALAFLLVETGVRHAARSRRTLLFSPRLRNE